MRGPRPVEPSIRFWSKVSVTGFCWNWIAGTSRGYGRFHPTSSRSVQAHRFAYELLVGEIPGDLQLDHLCRNRLCVNPDHLEPVTGKVNVLRGFSRAALNSVKTHCKRGHEFTPENTYVAPGSMQRLCRECARLAGRRRVRPKRAYSAEDLAGMPHGISATYNKGCRCPDCFEYKRRQNRRKQSDLHINTPENLTPTIERIAA